jgi:DNA helicase-2/ATP-dependent DNA helicase PcrA
MSKTYTPSPQQAAFLDWCANGSGSCVLEAVAGAGKTTTLLEGIDRTPGSVALLVYNKRNAVELQDKLKKRGVNWDKAKAGTVHSFGKQAYSRTFPKARVERDKVRNIMDQLINPNSDVNYYRGMVGKLVSLAKQRCLGLIGSIDDTTEWMDIADHFDIFATGKSDKQPPVEAIIAAAKQVLRKNNSITDVIDFDDMCYLPLLLKLPFWPYDVVMIDEAQDTNPARRALVHAMLKPNGRVIAVGDRHQAIYGFTGADNDSLDLIQSEFNAIRLPMTITYRCPKAVVAFAQQWVSHIECADTAPEGNVSMISMEDFSARKDLNGDSAVLSRTTKPLLQLAFGLIRRRIACKIEGRDDVGAKIIKLMQRWKVRSLDALSDKLDTYLERETKKLLDKKQEAKLDLVTDLVDTVRVIIDQCQKEKKNTLEDAVAYVDNLFGEDVTGMLVLSTIHKSKGREWEHVFWLDRTGTCPSKWAKQQWMKEQEVNLMYVAATRAKAELIEVLADSKDEKAPRKQPEATPAPAVEEKTPLTADDKKAKLREDKRRRAKARREKAKLQ